MGEVLPSDHEHEWVDDGMLELFPPIALSHCAKCGWRRHVNTGTGKVTYLPPK